MKHTFLFAALLVVLTVLLGVPFVAGGTDSVAVIVQADSVETAAAIVDAYGGELNEQLAIINAVSATLPSSVLEAVAADARTVALHQDEEASVAGINAARRGNRLDATFPEVMGVDDVWADRVWGKRIGVAVVDTGIALDTWNVLPRCSPLRCPGRRCPPARSAWSWHHDGQPLMRRANRIVCRGGRLDLAM